jgi:hypothetical protein
MLILYALMYLTVGIAILAFLEDDSWTVFERVLFIILWFIFVAFFIYAWFYNRLTKK